MKRLSILAVLPVAIFFLFFTYSCIKDILNQKDYRDQYTGNWAFKVYHYRISNFISMSTYDSSYYYGSIMKSGKEKEIIIDYGKSSVTRNVNSDGIIEYTGTADNHNGGCFGGDDEVIWDTYWRTNSASEGTSIYGTKELPSSVKNKPVVNAISAYAITMGGAVLSGSLKSNYLFTEITFEFGATTDYGRSVKPRPDVYSGNEEMVLSASVYGLDPATVYHYRIKAVNEMGTSYSEDMVFTTVGAPDPVTDIDGNVYKTTLIGTQLWMAENLRTTRYADGSPIQLIIDQDGWNNAGTTAKAFCYYNDDISTAKEYGAFYNWAAAMNGNNESSANPSGVQGVCPTGWHLPSESEWSTLEQFIGGSGSGWKTVLSEQNGGTNETGFSAIRVGRRTTYPYSFINFGTHAFFWTTTLYPNFNAIYIRSGSSNGWLYRTDGISVRCLKNSK